MGGGGCSRHWTGEEEKLIWRLTKTVRQMQRTHVLNLPLRCNAKRNVNLMEDEQVEQKELTLLITKKNSQGSQL